MFDSVEYLLKQFVVAGSMKGLWATLFKAQSRGVQKLFQQGQLGPDHIKGYGAKQSKMRNTELTTCTDADAQAWRGGQGCLG